MTTPAVPAAALEPRRPATPDHHTRSDMTTDPLTDRLREAARRAHHSLCDLIGDSPDPGTEALAARFELEQALANTAPAAPVAAPPTGQAATLTEVERAMLAYALDQAQERIWSEDGFTDEDQAAVDSLRRLAAETPTAPPGCWYNAEAAEEAMRAESMAAETPRPETQGEAHPAEHTWAAELHDPLTEEWVPGTRYVDRDRAVNHLTHARSIGPTWKDGTPTERRLVRATTTYTVEDEAPRCGAWGGCTLPRGHNIGQADIPENHQPAVTLPGKEA